MCSTGSMAWGECLSSIKSLTAHLGTMGAMGFFCDELDTIDTFLGIRAWHSTFISDAINLVELVTLLAKSRQCQ